MNTMRYMLSNLLLTALLALGARAYADELRQPRPGLLTGGQPTLQQLDGLAAQGVHTVIDLRGDHEDRGYDEAKEVEQRKLRYLRLPIAGKDDLTAANATALKQLLQESGDGVLLHCASGNRVGGLLALMATQQEHLPAEQALQLGKAAGLKSLQPVVAEKLGLPPQVDAEP